jgi:mannose-6-phosphate isomerase-like protein (cupin superfamily)
MLIKRLRDCPEIVANDGCRLRELLHPEHDASAVPYSLAFAWVDPGQATLPHKLRGQTEVYSILRGRGRMHIGGEEEDVAEGDSIVIPAASVQWIENTGTETLFFAAIVSPPWRAKDDVRVEPVGACDR